jgi:hypothetical protein
MPTSHRLIVSRMHSSTRRPATDRPKSSSRPGVTCLGIALSLILVSCTSLQSTESTVDVPEMMTTPTRPEVDPNDYTMDEIVDGGTLDWQSSISSDLRFLDMIRVGDTEFVLATGEDGRGLWLWSTTDGLTWLDLGQVIADDSAMGVVGSDETRLLVSTVAMPGQAPAMWRSTNGADWETDRLPEPDNPLTMVDAMALGGSPSMVILAAKSRLDPRQLLADQLMSFLPAGTDLTPLELTWAKKEDDIVFRVLTPLGFVAAELTGDQLELTKQQRAWLLDEPSPTALDLWIQYSGEEWGPWALEGVTKAIDIFDLADGEVLISGESPAPTPTGSSLSLWRTYEGFSWERDNTPDRPLEVEGWGDRRIGPSATGDSDLLVGDATGAWTRTYLALRFPVVPEWTVTHTAGDESGVVASVETIDASTPPQGFVQRTIEKDGWTLVAERPGQILLFDTDQQSFHEYVGGGSSLTENVSIDLVSQTVTFRDESGNDLVTFTFGELAAPDEVSPSLGYGRHALAYSPDASSWTLWDLTGVVKGRWLGGVGIAQGQAMVAVVDGERGFDIMTAGLR